MQWGNRLTLCLRACDVDDAAHERLRVEISLGCCHPSVHACLGVLDKGVSPRQALAIRASTVHAIQASIDSWTAFTHTIRSLLRLESSNREEFPNPWQALLASEYHAHASIHLNKFLPAGNHGMLDGRDETDVCRGSSDCRTAELHSNASVCLGIGVVDHHGMHEDHLSAKTVVEILYHVYEEFKLCLLTWRFVRPLGVLLASISDDPAYADRFSRDVLGIAHASQLDAGKRFLAADVYEWMSATIKHGFPNYTLKTLEIPQRFNRAVFLSIAFSSLVRGSARQSTEHANQIVLAMTQAKFDIAGLSTWPPGIVLPLYDALLTSRSCPPAHWHAQAYILAGRNDLALLVDSSLFRPLMSICGIHVAGAGRGIRKDSCIPMSPGCPILHDENISQRVQQPQSSVSQLRYSANDEVARSLCEVCMLRYGDDIRISDVYRTLDSASAVEFQIERPPEVSDHQFEEEKQNRLLLACMRSCAAPCGRALLTLASHPVQTLTEVLEIPKICHFGRLCPSNATVALDAASIAKLGVWPDFHNGVAAGLCIQDAAATSNLGDRKIQTVTRAWVVFNRPERPAPEHGGLLFALGLQQHLDILSMTDVYEYLTLGDDPTAVGVLLGMAACKRGTSDAAISKMLCLHIPALLPQPFKEMDVSPVAQAAAIAGVGLLYQGTANRLMAEFLLSEISNPASCDKLGGREAYCLAAGIALGMVILGMGTMDTATGLADLCIAERLHHAIAGGRRTTYSMTSNLFNLTEASTTSDIEPCVSSLLSTSECVQQGYYFNYETPSGSSSRRFFPVKSSRVRENDHINTDVTAPGAILAFGLFFVKSNCHSAASCIGLPDTLVLLDAVRPDFLMLRVVSRALILWHEVKSPVQWVECQIPEAVKHAIDRLRRETRGRCGSIPEDRMAAIQRKTGDWDTIRQVHAYIIAGACFALGVRFAGTGCKDAARTLHHYLEHFKSFRRTYIANHPGSGAQREPTLCSTVPVEFSSDTEAEALSLRPDRITVETCIGVTAIALGMVFAGTADISLLRELRQLRRRIDDDVSYGTHQAIHMAMGLLFIGGGRASLMRTQESVSALVCAFFPRFPQHPDDNQYHLQPLRHLWVLGVEWRGLRVIDIDSCDSISVPVIVTLNSGVDWAQAGDTIALHSPCLLPPLQDIASLEVSSPNFYPVVLHTGNNTVHTAALRRLGIFVKRRCTALSSSSCYSLLTLNWPTTMLTSYSYHRCDKLGLHPRNDVHIVDVLRDSWVLMFARLFCDDPVPEPCLQHLSEPLSITPGSTFSNACNRILVECTACDRLHMFHVYLQLHHYARQLAESAESLQAWSLRLCLEYANPRSVRSQLSVSELINREFAAALQVNLSKSLQAALDKQAHPASSMRKRLLGCQDILRFCI